MTLTKLLAATLAIALVACGPSAPGGDPADAGAGPVVDEDGDSISDVDEGRAAATDSDGDGTPDFQDTDSDGDGVADAEEAGDTSLTSRPVDSDFDGTPDFRDSDSDGNGRADGVDGTADTDGDHRPDFADSDDDGDDLPDQVELGSDPAQPVDTDGDGSPDFRDADSDNDSLTDRQERASDPDNDGVPAFRDLDSDGDCRADALEAGDADLGTPPVDSDVDGAPDFVDLDSDNDGLTDTAEDANCDGMHGAGESSATSADSDGDGVSDLVEVAAGTDPNDMADNPQANGDFVFLEPYMAAASPPEDRLKFATAFRNVDLFFNIDISGSMSNEITSIKNNIATVIDALTCNAGEDPVTTGCIPDLQTGVATFGNVANPAITNFGKEISAINVNADGANSTQSKLPTTANGSGFEQALRSMGADETGTANDGFLRNACATDAARFGRACFRPNALRLIVEATDEQLTEDDAFRAGTHQSIIDFAMQNNVQLIGVWSDSPNLGGLRDQWAGLSSGGVPFVPVLASTAIGTPACNALGGSPFHVFQNMARAIVQGDGTASANAITCAVQAVVRFVKQDVGPHAINDPANLDAHGNPVDAPAVFIQRIETFMDGSPECPTHPTVQDSNGDGSPDLFVGILPGKKVCWKIFVKDNIVVKPDAEPQMFRATIEVKGQGGALLDSREVFFLVPPEIVNPPIE